MAYPTAAQLVADSNVEELTSLPADEQEVLRQAAIVAVEEYCNQSFLLEEDVTRYVDGTGVRTLYLPKRLETLTTLAVTGSGLTGADVFLSEKKDRIMVKPDAGIGNYYEKTMRDLDGNLPLNFRFGIGTVAITGDWGWAAVPTNVATALRIDMEDQALSDANALSDTIRSARALGLRDLSQGNLSAYIADSTTLSHKAQRLLDPYVWIGQIGAVI